ncbi:MAG: tRNA (adenosine(37)-N6)-threonylcarbamoyltransferase complex ATPase subunit type 1 TsaE [Pseudomonadota bacterium]
MGQGARFEITLRNQLATETLGRTLAVLAEVGDVFALSGHIGAGKSVLARAFIKKRLDDDGRSEDIPSPTFTLVQTYETASVEIWHCDLYRVTHADEVLELGLDNAFETGVCLIEWPDRMGPDLPDHTLHINLQPERSSDSRLCSITSKFSGWSARLKNVLETSHG